MRGLAMLAGAALFGSGAMALWLPAPGAAPETIRLRRHFAVVREELLARDVSALSPEQRMARAEQIRLLRRYATEGNFPRNEYLPGRVPFFRDREGNLCAMAFLIAASGRGDIVDKVARTRNNAYIPDLVDEPGLAAWLDRHGLSLAEAARIQPTYGGDSDSDTRASTVIAAGAAGTLSLASLIWNARSMERLAGHRTRTLVGLGAAAINLGIGLAYIGDDGARPTFGIINLAVGVPAAILGIRALGAKSKSKADPGNTPRFAVAPSLTTGARPRFGFTANFRF
jgi:hypothetical protein